MLTIFSGSSGTLPQRLHDFFLPLYALCTMRNLLKQHRIKTPAPASNWRKSSLELLLQMTKPSSSSEKQTFHSKTDSAPKHLQILSKSQQGSCAMRGTISIKHSSHLSSSFCFQSIVPPSLLPHQENRQEDEPP